MSSANQTKPQRRPVIDGSDGHDAFWIWLGKKAAKGEMECGNEEAAEQLLGAFMAGWLHGASHKRAKPQ